MTVSLIPVQIASTAAFAVLGDCRLILFAGALVLSVLLCPGGDVLSVERCLHVSVFHILLDRQWWMISIRRLRFENHRTGQPYAQQTTAKKQ